MRCTTVCGQESDLLFREYTSTGIIRAMVTTHLLCNHAGPVKYTFNQRLSYCLVRSSSCWNNQTAYSIMCLVNKKLLCRWNDSINKNHVYWVSTSRESNTCRGDLAKSWNPINFLIPATESHYVRTRKRNRMMGIWVYGKRQQKKRT